MRATGYYFAVTEMYHICFRELLTYPTPLEPILRANPCAKKVKKNNYRFLNKPACYRVNHNF